MEEGYSPNVLPEMYILKIMDLHSPITSYAASDGIQEYAILKRVGIKRGQSLVYGRQKDANSPIAIPIRDNRFSREHGIISVLEEDRDNFPGVIIKDNGKNKPKGINLRKQHPRDDPSLRIKRIMNGEQTRLYPKESIDYFNSYRFEIE